jgi:hypothetical protein
MSDPGQFETYAERCEAAAAVAADPCMRRQFQDLAGQWRCLATLLRSLRAETAGRGDYAREQDYGA